MLVLGVESSCDETALALVEDGRLVDQTVASQEDLHALFGGVVPELASREHARVLPELFRRFRSRVGLDPSKLSAIAVARGPGLLGCLLVGVCFAKGLAQAYNIPLVGVQHVQAHLLAAGLEHDLLYPALGLAVSGGHTELSILHDPCRFTRLGKTVDDAAGEALDKAAKLFNLPYPGGRFVDALAYGLKPDKSLFPRPYLDNPSCDFSFSGLKTAVANFVAAHPELRLPRRLNTLEELRAEAPAGLDVVMASVLWAISDTLRVKFSRALDQNPNSRCLVLAGGVAASQVLRTHLSELATERRLPLFVPSPALCTDNAAMIAYAGWQLRRAGFGHGLDLEAIARGKSVPFDYQSDPLAQVV